jgi:hypothetical protein
LRENKLAPITSQNKSLSSDGIQYGILAVLNARASIYRLRVQMGNCCDKYGRRPDNEPEPSGQTIVEQKIMSFLLKIFLV